MADNFISGSFATPLQAAPAVRPTNDAPRVSPFQQLGFIVLVIFLFIIYSRVFDVKFYTLHIPGISFAIIAAMVLLSRCFVTALHSSTGRALLAFTCWFTISVPFSVWKGGSFAAWKTWLSVFLIYLASAGLVASYAQCRRAVNAVAVGLFVLAIIALVFGTATSGRLFLTQGKFSNPNEMAQALLLGLPLWWRIYLSSRVDGVKLVCLGVIVLMVYTLSKTGSRGAFVAFVVLFVLVFFRSSITGKVNLLVVGLTLMCLIAVTMPSKLRSRFTTLSEDSEIAAEMDDGMTERALASTASRKQLLLKSLKLTAEHPILGVGPDMFVVAENSDALAAGKRKGMWLGTHNSYTQVSSEMGIPGLIFYVVAIGFAMRGSYRMFRRTRGDPRLQHVAEFAICLNYTLAAFAITIFFSHIAYSSMIAVLTGLTVSFLRTAEEEIARATAPPAGAAAALPADRFAAGIRRPAWMA